MHAMANPPADGFAGVFFMQTEMITALVTAMGAARQWR
ncbi:hypothetical protein NOR51B_136 [Luminiphilus syltensis NOR5-1B]|uniref:Uncharacterized protein n=1 Tax=Luminiphilus syltensis NOR5-1B TaxID=565045 RepID=B8KT63_9GAMM|nr:hypothetical protein NOR51B_136 [Luminiphilus syltensis NOR5-1B]